MSEWAALLVTVDPWDMAPEGSWPGVVFKESFGVLTVGEFLVTDGAPPPVGVSREGFRRGRKRLTETLEQVLSQVSWEQVSEPPPGTELLLALCCLQA